MRARLSYVGAGRPTFISRGQHLTAPSWLYLGDATTRHSQYVEIMWRCVPAFNMERRMPAMRLSQDRIWQHASHAVPECVRPRAHQGSCALVIPALRVADQEVAKRLHARHRFELFRIDKISVERWPLFLAEQLHQADIFLDQIIRQ